MTRDRRHLEARHAADSNDGAVIVPGVATGADEFRPGLAGLGTISAQEMARLQKGGDDGFKPMPPVALQTEAEGDAATESDGGSGAGADRMLTQARKQAEAILAEARQAAEQLQAEAQQRVEQAVAERARKVAEAVRCEQEQSFRAAAEELLQSFGRAADEVLEELSGQVAELAAAVTAKVIRRKVEADDTIVVDMVAEAMGRLSDCKRLRVVVNPAEESAVAAQREALLKRLGGLEELQIVGSDGVERGGCMLESDRGEVDARISSQLQVIWEQVPGGEAVEKTA
jgi:flagellar assembly protein FliH